jgi:hypothetical protein
MKRAAAWSRLPELSVMLFGLLLNYPWEFIQAPLFEGMGSVAHWEGVKTCTRAALGDAVIMVFAYWGVALLTRGRDWIVAPRWRETLLLVSIGVSVTVLIERLALHDQWFSAWRYSAAMPVIPGLDVGLVPVLQWVFLPPLMLALAGAHLRGCRSSS